MNKAKKYIEKNRGFLEFLKSLYKPVKMLTIIMIASMIISQALDLVKQYIIKGIIDLPNTNGFQITDLYRVIFILLGVIILELIFYYTSNITRTIYMLKKQTPYISEKLFNNLNKKAYPFFIDNYSGKIASSINEINDETQALNEKITSKFISILTSMISSLIILYTIDVKIFIVALILFFGIIITRSIYFSKRFLPAVKKAQEYNREYNGILNDAVLNFTSLKIYSAIESFSKTLKGKKEDANLYRNNASKKEFTYGAVANVIYIIVFTILMLYSVKMYSNNLMSLGNLIFFINAMITLKSQTTSFTWAYIHIGETLVKIKNSYQLLYEDNNIIEDNKDEINIANGNVEFRNVFFKYNKKYIFEDFNLNIENKEKIGVIGISGSGKTTLVNLLFKFYSPENGKILIDNKDIQNYNTKSLYNNLTYVPQ